MAIAELRSCRRLLIRHHRPTQIFPKCPSDGNFVINSILRRLSTSVESLAAGDRNPQFDECFLNGNSVNPFAVENLGFEKQEGEAKEASGKGVNKWRSVMEEEEAWRLLNKAVVSYCGSPVGTVSADDDVTAAREKLNYDQVFIGDFVPSAIAFLLKGRAKS